MSALPFAPNVFAILARMLAVFCLLLPLAHAQYQWRDANGRMVISDQPPPAGTKPSQVLRAEPMKPPPPAGGGVSFSGKATPAERNANGTPAKAEDDPKAKAEALKKQKEEAERAAVLARLCEETRTEVRTLESGMRVGRVNAQGEREYLSDEDRAKRVETAKREIRDNCKAG